MTGARHGDLVGRAVHQLAASQLLDQIGIGVFFHQGDAMLDRKSVV